MSNISDLDLFVFWLNCFFVTSACGMYVYTFVIYRYKITENNTQAEKNSG